MAEESGAQTPRALMREMGIDEDELEARKRFLQFEAEDVRRLEQADSLAQTYAGEVIEDFYRHLLSFAETRKFFQDPDVLTYVKQRQTEYFVGLTSGHYDTDYAAERLAIGAVHERIGLPIKSYLGMYNFYLRAVAERLADAYGADASTARTTFLSLMKLTFLDMGLAIDTYIFERERTIQEHSEAHRANEAKTEFISRMSHELRTPLNAILGFAQLLQLNASDPPTTEAVHHILGAGRHLLRLIDEVLDLSRIESNRLSLSLEPVHLREVVDVSLELTQPMAADRQIECYVATSGLLDEFVLVDRQRLQQVLLNLLSNAIKYNREGGSVMIRAESRPEDRLRLCVQDTGTGIPTARLDRLFSPFDRLGAEQLGIEGTGLGLAISKRLVEAMEGSIGVESTEGQGSNFWIEFPRAEETPEEAFEGLGNGVPAHATARGAAAVPVLSVLYIEDNLPNLTLVERILEEAGKFSFLPAMQGRLGLELARQHRPGLILLDLDLPDITGLDVLIELKADTRTRDIPVIVISADASRRLATRLTEVGACAYLTKPLDVREFLDAVASARSEA